jgi:hypothetical protein
MILYHSLPRFKSFLAPAALSPAAYGHVLRFVLCFLFHPGRMSVAKVAAFLRSDLRVLGTLTRFLAQRCPSLGVLAAAQQSLLAVPCRRDGLWFFLVDSTFNGQQGQRPQNTFSRGNTQARKRKSNRKQYKHHRRSCHGFVFGVLLRPDGVRIPYWLPYYTRDYCQLLRVPYLTQTQLAAELLRDLTLPAAEQLVVLGDTAFEAESIRRVCEAHDAHWVVPLNPERRLAGPKPRRQVRALLKELSAASFTRIRLEPSSDAYAKQRRAARCRRRSMRKGRSYWVHSRIAEVHSVGRVVLLFSNKEAPHEGETLKADKVLISNATEASVSELLSWYGLRWQVELFFKELKSELKLGQYRFVQFRQVEGWVELCVLSLAYLEWYRAKQLQQRDLPEEERQEWEAARTHGLKEKLRAQLEQEELTTMQRWLGSARGRHRLKTYLRAASTPQGRSREAG